jgi:Domain of unknown function (DUF4160)
MPTIFEVDGIRVMLLIRDHPPPHVHLFSAEGTAKIRLNCPAGPLEEYDNTGLSLKQIRKVKAGLEPQIASVCAQWRKTYAKR